MNGKNWNYYAICMCVSTHTHKESCSLKHVNTKMDVSSSRLKQIPRLLHLIFFSKAIASLQSCFAITIFLNNYCFTFVSTKFLFVGKVEHTKIRFWWRLWVEEISTFEFGSLFLQKRRDCKGVGVVPVGYFNPILLDP